MYNFNFTPTVRNLMLANLAVLLLQQNVQFNPSLTELGSLFPFGSPHLHFWQFFTHMFLHSDWGHLFSNMFGLLIFGPMLEERWGGRRFLAFWLLCGVGSGLLYNGVRTYELHRMQQAAMEFHEVPSGGELANFYRTYFPGARGYETLAGALDRNPDNAEYLDAATKSVDATVSQVLNSPYGMLGASGALFGIMFAFAYLFPTTEIRLYLFIPVKAAYLVFIYSAFELWQGVHRVPGDNIAHFAHLGGLLVGFIVIKLWELDRRKFY